LTDNEELFTAMNARKNSNERYGKQLATFAKCFAPLAVKFLCNYFLSYPIRGYIDRCWGTTKVKKISINKTVHFQPR